MWALLAPRSQWFVFASWSYRDTLSHEPSDATYLLYRIVAALGIAATVASGIVVLQTNEAAEPPAPVLPTLVEQMWGTPVPVVVNRVIKSASTPPKGLVNQPILGYQLLDGQTRQPPYLFDLKTFDLDTATTENGFVGKNPRTGLVALDMAQLVVRVEGDQRCFPHAAIVRESTETITVAIYYGQPDPEDGSNKDRVADCSNHELSANVSTLIPLQLTGSLGERKIVTMDGTPIPAVPLRKGTDPTSRGGSC